MPLDTATRNALAGIVGTCRAKLTEDVCSVFEGEFGLLPDGTRIDVGQLAHLAESGRSKAWLLREWQDHLSALEKSEDEDERHKGALQRMVHETAFTALNRLVALRLCEERGYVFECVRKGTESEGFRLFERLAGGVLGSRGQTYRVFLTELFRDLAVELGVLFDVDAPQSVVMPGSGTLETVLDELAAELISGVWEDDETIGWVFQYFNSAKEREDMRKASAAPRNSRELAVRNQFFTPRYVVEFLVDNTLGRIWYEMLRGETRLKERCQYLVYRPAVEVFLARGEEPPPEPDTSEMSREELLQLPLHVRWRDMKDPRDLRIIDPACGSGHFLLYAFELLTVIYEEAWDLESPASSQLTGQSLRDDYATRDELMEAIPGLIVSRNLAGVDIDPRAAQVASLALWLRAQRYSRDQGVKLPPMSRGEIVCAEPVPIDDAVLADFEATTRPVIIGRLASALLESLQMADELGVLLKVDEQLSELVEDARWQWIAASREEQLALSPELAPSPSPDGRQLDLSDIDDEVFWEVAERAIAAALVQYAGLVHGEGINRRRFFSTEAREALVFFDLCRRRYDVILMNPPFGEPAKASKPYIQKAYPLTKNDLYAVFVERGLDMLLARGCLGAITSRTGFFLSSFQKWREQILLARADIGVFADLGYGVLDAMVETAAYCLERKAGA